MYIYILVHGKYRPTSFITQHAFFSALRVQCVWFTTVGLGLSLKVNHTCTYARQVLLGCAHFTIPKVRFSNEINPAYGSYMNPDSGHFFYLVWR